MPIRIGVFKSHLSYNLEFFFSLVSETCRVNANFTTKNSVMVVKSGAPKPIPSRVSTMSPATNLSAMVLAMPKATTKNLLNKSEWEKKEDRKWNPKRNKNDWIFFVKKRDNKSKRFFALDCTLTSWLQLAPLKVFRHWHCIEVVICDCCESNLRHFPKFKPDDDGNDDAKYSIPIFHFKIQKVKSFRALPAPPLPSFHLRASK